MLIFRFPPPARTAETENKDVSVLRFNLYDPLRPNTVSSSVLLAMSSTMMVLYRANVETDGKSKKKSDICSCSNAPMPTVKSILIPKRLTIESMPGIGRPRDKQSFVQILGPLRFTPESKSMGLAEFIRNTDTKKKRCRKDDHSPCRIIYRRKEDVNAFATIQYALVVSLKAFIIKHFKQNILDMYLLLEEPDIHYSYQHKADKKEVQGNKWTTEAVESASD